MTSQNARLAAGGRIDRTISWRFTVDGEEFTGHPGDTLASALIANGVLECGPSLYRQRPRGVLAAGVEESNALVRLRRPGARFGAWQIPSASTSAAAASRPLPST